MHESLEGNDNLFSNKRHEGFIPGSKATNDIALNINSSDPQCKQSLLATSNCGATSVMYF